jgi:hypothetical protein
MRMILIVLLASGCVGARRECGMLRADDVVEFHHSHELSNGANESSVAGLAVEGWVVCVESGVATIQNHQTAQEKENAR